MTFRSLVITLCIVPLALASCSGGDNGGGGGPAPRRFLADYDSVSTSADRPVDDEGSPRTDPKLILTTDFSMSVDDLGEFTAALPAILDRHGARVAHRVGQGAGSVNPHGTWTVRVPNASHDALVSEMQTLGEVYRTTTSTNDVTEQFTDDTARLASQKTLEGRLLGLLESRAGTLEDVLRVETELTRVRSEIERLTGRLRVLDDRTTFATVTVHVEQRVAASVAPAEPEPGLLDRISGAWEASVTGLAAFGSFMLVLLAGLAPWTPLIVLAIWGARRYAKSSQPTA